MQYQLSAFIKTAESLQIKGLAAVNNNNNSTCLNNNTIKPEPTKTNSTTPIQDITKFNAYGPHTPTNVKYELNNGGSPPTPPMPLTPTEPAKSPLPFGKKRR